MYSKSFKDKLVLDIIKNFKSSVDLNIQIKNGFSKYTKDKYTVLRLKRYHFPKGFDDVLVNFISLIEEKIIKSSKLKKKSFINLRVHKKIIFIIIERFKMVSVYKNSLAEILLYILKNGKFFFANKILFTIADQTWHLSGDKSLDFNFYTKRLILMKVLILSFVFWLRKENSSSLVKTKAYTEKIIMKVLSFGKIKSFAMNILKRF